MMKKVLALVVAAAMGLSSAAFAADAVANTAAPAATSTAAPAAKTVQHKKHKKVAVQKAQAAKKHHKKLNVSATGTLVIGAVPARWQRRFFIRRALCCSAIGLR